MIDNFDYLIRHIEDKLHECERNYAISATAFLDMTQKTAVIPTIRNVGTRFIFYGGYEDAERNICVFYPDYIDDIYQHFIDSPEDNPLKILRCRLKPGATPLSHRDYLGALMGLGIKRETIGDIIVKNDGADIIFKREMEDYLYASLSNVGRMSVETEVVDIQKLRTPEYRVTETRGTVPSLRLDAVIAEAFNLSREKAAQSITQGLVYLDSIQQTKIDAKVKEGSKLVLRGSGKCILKEILGQTKKDRTAILLQKFM